jgi:uncharacterized protein (DUF1697 family)
VPTALFLSKRAPATAASQLDPDHYRPSEFAVGDRVVYLRLPNGVMGSPFPDVERAFGLRATMRTWNTVTRLHELAGG